MIFWTGDLHVNHVNVLIHCNRPFKNVHEHNEQLLANWNSVVGQKDHIYVLGDFVWKDKRYAVSFVRRLHGKIFYLKGNHDRAMKGEVLELINDVGQYHELTVQDKDAPGGKRLIVMCHYPIESWNRKHFLSWHLHAHCHGNLHNVIRNRVDVGVDCWNYTPVSYDQIKEYLNNQVKNEDSK